MGRIPDNVLEEILGRVDIVEVISGFLPLKRAGRNFKALCPFHHEKTSSFMVSPDRQIYHCFGCGESGNAFKFLMRYERLEFPEAVEALAKKAGVVLPDTQKQDARAGQTTELYKINEAAASFYQVNLSSSQGQRSRDYLVKRGITKEAIELFGLGLALDKWDALLGHLRAGGFGLSALEKTGLVSPKEKGGYYDRFRNRIIFPIRDIKSRVIAFGARVLDDTLPKYINSPETAVYIKGKNLYGLSLAKESIRDCDCAAVVEGYMDFILPYAAGFKNIVASLGTAFTPEQARLIKRYSHNVVMVYDADKAGEIATLRSLDILIEEDMSVKVVTLPPGFDPDLFVRKFGCAAFKQKIDGAQDLFDYKMQVLKSRHDPKEIDGKVKISRQMLETIGKIGNSVLKSEYIKKLAQGLDVREEALLQELKKLGKPAALPGSQPVYPASTGISPLEKLLIKLMLEEEKLIHRLKEDLGPQDFADARVARIISTMFEFVEQGRQVEPSVLMDHIGADDITRIISESVFLPGELSGQEKEKIFDDCLLRIKHEKSKLKRQRLHEEIKSAQGAGDEEKLRGLMEEFHLLIRSK